jgi:cell division septation protein DedD
MKNKDFREIQVSSSLLVVIFLGVLALGVFIFLLGVSVGKKQIAVAAPTEIVTQQIPEPAKEPPLKPSPADQGVEAQDPSAMSPAPGGPGTAAKQPAVTKAPPPKPAGETKKPAVSPPSGSRLYFVQVAAFTTRAQAEAAAEKYRAQGYTTVVTDPKPADTKTWYRVRLGGYATRDKAVTLLAKLNAAAGKKTDFRVVQD